MPMELANIILNMVTKLKDLKKYIILYETVTIQNGKHINTHVLTQFLISAVSMDLNLHGDYVLKRESYGNRYSVTYQLSSNMLQAFFYHNNENALKYFVADRYCGSGTEVIWRLSQKYYLDRDDIS